MEMFSAERPKAQVHYCDHSLSIVDNFWIHIFDFFSETAEPNSMKFNRKQDLNVLYQVCFSGQSQKQNGHPSLSLAETFLTFPSETTVLNSTKLDREQDLNVPYQVCVFHADQEKNWPIRQKGGTLYSGARYAAFWREFENVSASQRPGLPSYFSNGPEKHKLGRGRLDLASC